MSERNNDDPDRREGPVGQKTGPVVRWDESNSRTISPTICTISATPQEFALLFGREDSLREKTQQRTVYGAERLIVSPLIAKRLAASLDEVLRQYEMRFGPLEPTRHDWARQTAKPTFPDLLAPEPAAVPDRGRLLFDLVTALGAETALERSFKVCKGRLLENRFLLAVKRVKQDDVLDEKMKQVCSNLDMPASFIRAFAASLADANHVYFGFEEDGSRSLYKAYLEFRDHAEEKMKAEVPAPSPLLLHLGFKWDTSDKNRKAITRYEWYHSISFRDILERLPSMLLSSPGHDSLTVAEAIIGLAADRMDSRDVQYVEVTEKGNSRKSFDINLYKSGVRLAELKPFLLNLADYYDLDRQEFAIFCDGITAKRFGHLAGGIDREGRDFVTIYYGVEHLRTADA